MSNETRRAFLQAIDELKPSLKQMGFIPHSQWQQGYATWVRFEGQTGSINLFCGPADYHVQILVELKSPGRAMKYEFADLLKIPVLARWVQDNSVEARENESLLTEAQWFLELVKFALDTGVLAG